MPLYEFICEKHGIFEKYLPVNRWDIRATFCEVAEDCDEMAERVEFSLTNMQPDPYWAGHVVHGEYVTSKSKVRKDVVPATRDNVEYVKKRKEIVRKEIEERNSNNLKKFLTNELSQYTIEPDGYTPKQRRKFEKRRNENGSDSTNQ